MVCELKSLLRYGVVRQNHVSFGKPKFIIIAWAKLLNSTRAVQSAVRSRALITEGQNNADNCFRSYPFASLTTQSRPLPPAQLASLGHHLLRIPVFPSIVGLIVFIVCKTVCLRHFFAVTCCVVGRLCQLLAADVSLIGRRRLLQSLDLRVIGNHRLLQVLLSAL